MLLAAILITIESLTCIATEEGCSIECKNVQVESEIESLVNYESIFSEMDAKGYRDALACATLGYGNPESEDYPGSGYHDAKEAPENEGMREEQRRENEAEGI